MRTIAHPNTGFIFPRPRRHQQGQPQTSNLLSHHVALIIKKAGITGNKLGPHTFRHTGATLVAADTESAIAVQAVTGHAKIEVAMGYVHDIQQRAAQKHSPLEIAARSLQDTNEHMSQTALIPVNPQPSKEPTKEIVINPDGTILGTGHEWLDEMFKQPSNTKSVRPRFSPDDLQFLRRVLQTTVQYGTVIGDDAKARDLWTRILRKA